MEAALEAANPARTSRLETMVISFLRVGLELHLIGRGGSRRARFRGDGLAGSDHLSEHVGGQWHLRGCDLPDRCWGLLIWFGGLLGVQHQCSNLSGISGRRVTRDTWADAGERNPRELENTRG